MRIIVMGTGPFAVPTCKRLLAEGHDIPLVVTRPVADPTAKTQPVRPVFDWASQAGIDVYAPPSINTAEATATVAGYQADLLFVCDYGQILSRECLATTRLGGINLHGSILPRHRGAAPVQWTLLSGDMEAGVTVIHMTPRLDGGPALAIARTAIHDDETAEELEPRLAVLGVEATLSSILQLSQWDGTSPIGEMQDSGLVTKAPRLSKADGQLNFAEPADKLLRRVRACQPWPGTFAELTWPEGKHMRVIMRDARSITRTIPVLAGALPGTAIPITAEDIQQAWPKPWSKMLAVATGQGLFLIARIQPAGKQEMGVDEFLRGHPIKTTAQFALPQPSQIPTTTNP